MISSLLASILPKSSPQRDQRPRVALIHPEAGVSSNGGSQLSALELARHLQPYFQVTLLCSAKSTLPMGNDANDFVKILPALPRGRVKPWLHHPIIGPMLRPLAKNPEILIELLSSFLPYFWYLMRHPVDLLYPNNGYAGLVLANRVRALTGTPVLYTERAGRLADGKILQRDLGYQPDHMVVFDQDTLDIVHQSRPNQSASIIPNGVDLSRFSPQGDKINLGLPGPIVVCVGSLDKSNHKRIELTIQAMAKLPEYSLLICGDGPDRHYFQQMAYRYLASERIRFAAFGFEQMPAVYRSCDLFTLASNNEPFGRVYLEAMACGLPVVATDDAMRRSIIGQAGLLCDVTDIDIYAHKIQHGLKLKTQLGWQTEAKKQAIKFSWINVAEQYAELMLQMINDKAQGTVRDSV
ncbi:glycosyltransferase [Neptunicella sp.]|uniref:glycosyltransferase n=1 Tax=Neptunicella sp. TaxID=2125986 RepID=UPI003F68D484